MIDLAIDALSKHGRSEIAHVSVSSVENGSRRPLAATPIAARHARRLDVPRRIHANACVAMAAGISSVKLPLTLGANVGWRTMCEKCVEIDKAIERFRQVSWSICDQLTVERAKEVIADLEAKKATLHQEQKQKERITA
jgi:hypothetical protein